MKISTILDHIDSGHMALPEFQRGYVWNGSQVRGLFEALYRRHPVGGLLVWATEGGTAAHRGDGPVVAGAVKLLLDGQQRMTSLYGVIRGGPPGFFDGDERAFAGLHFHLGTETFSFWQPITMGGDPLWIDVTALMRGGNAEVGRLIAAFARDPEHAARVGDFGGRMNQLLGIVDIDLHVDEITGADKTLDVVVDIFNRVNSAGTKLSKGDLALAKVSVAWPEARDAMKEKIGAWADAGYDFEVDWLLRCVNTVLTGEASFGHLHDRSADDMRGGLEQTSRRLDVLLNLIAGRLGLDHDRVLFGRYAMPVMARYLDGRNGRLDERERDKLLFWFAQAGMWGRFSGSTEAMIDQDIATLERDGGGLDALIERLRLWRGSLLVEPGHFTVATLGARFYSVLYMLTRMGEARDLGTGLPLKASLLGKMSSLEVHHIFATAQLYKRGHNRFEVNALGNFCFLTKDTNIRISDRQPQDYFPEVEARHPGALASQWIPMDPELWRLDSYMDFLEARKILLAEATNKCLAELLHRDTALLAGGPVADVPAHVEVEAAGEGDEEKEIEALNDWVAERGLPRGRVNFDCADPETGAQKAVFDLAWPDGLQPGLTQPVAVLLNEPPEVLQAASSAGFRCFTRPDHFRAYVGNEILNAEVA